MAKVERPSRSITIGGVDVPPGERRTIDLKLGQLYNHNPVTMPVQVVHGRRSGPRLFVCAAVHGDELNGIEIVRRLLRHPALERLRGCLIAVPIVNVLGVVQHSRYLPDRRDLNRSFPGSSQGSLTARLAHLFMSEVVAKSTHGVDLHTGALHRSNLPHVRGDLEDAATHELAMAFGVPVVLQASVRDGSLRDAVRDAGIPVLLYEGGEALRFDELSIRTGVRGVLRSMRALGMLPKRTRRTERRVFVAASSTWVRAPISGIFRAFARLGDVVEEGQALGAIADPFGEDEAQILASADGVVLGQSRLPLAYEGDALFHIARLDEPAEHGLDDLLTLYGDTEHT